MKKTIVDYLEKTLKQYNLPDHRQDENYSQWNESYKLYEELKNKK